MRTIIDILGLTIIFIGYTYLLRFFLRKDSILSKNPISGKATKVSADFDDCHYILTEDNQCYRLGFIRNQHGIFPDAPIKIEPCELPLMLQETFGLIDTKTRIRLQEELAEEQRKERVDARNQLMKKLANKTEEKV